MKDVRLLFAVVIDGACSGWVIGAVGGGEEMEISLRSVSIRNRSHARVSDAWVESKAQSMVGHSSHCWHSVSRPTAMDREVLEVE